MATELRFNRPTHATSTSHMHSTEDGSLDNPKPVKKGGEGAKEQKMPLARALQLISEEKELTNRANSKAPTLPVVPLSTEHLKSHASLQNFLGDVEKTLRYAYVVGPAIRVVIAVIEMVGSIFASAVIALQAAFIFPENDSQEAKDAASFKQSEMLSNAQYTLTYACHGVTNLVRAAFEATIIGHIVLNVSYDRMFRHEYDLVDRNLGDNYHTRIFSPLVREENVAVENGDIRYRPDRTQFSGILESYNLGFNGRKLASDYREALKFQREHAEFVKNAKKALSELAKDFASARTVASEAFAEFDRIDAAEKAYESKLEKAGEDQKALAAARKEAPKKLTREQVETVRLVEEFRQEEKLHNQRQSHGAIIRAGLDMYGSIDEDEAFSVTDQVQQTEEDFGEG